MSELSYAVGREQTGSSRPSAPTLAVCFPSGTRTLHSAWTTCCSSHFPKTGFCVFFCVAPHLCRQIPRIFR